MLAEQGHSSMISVDSKHCIESLKYLYKYIHTQCSILKQEHNIGIVNLNAVFGIKTARNTEICVDNGNFQIIQNNI